jgi:hypothetical protein
MSRRSKFAARHVLDRAPKEVLVKMSAGGKRLETKTGENKTR